jgi:hypothetical protein
VNSSIRKKAALSKNPQKLSIYQSRVDVSSKKKNLRKETEAVNEKKEKSDDFHV